MRQTYRMASFWQELNTPSRKLTSAFKTQQLQSTLNLKSVSYKTSQCMEKKDGGTLKAWKWKGELVAVFLLKGKESS